MLHLKRHWKNRRAWLLPLVLIVTWVLPSEAEVDSSYSINPTKTAADKAFTLDLLTYQFNCGTTYDMLSASVNGNAISLTFLDHDAPAGTVCPLIYRQYGPTFSLPGLHSGIYTVKAFRLPACAAQHCPFAAIPGVDAGTLMVGTAADRAGWFLKDKEVAPGKSFSLQLLNNKYGNCQTSFSHASVNLQNGEIWSTFLIENYPERLCIMDIYPNGPSFDMVGLKPGSYPVRAIELQACQLNVPPCPILSILPDPFDTLVVITSTARLSQSPASFVPSAFFQGERIHLFLPGEPDGKWRAELLTTTGRILKAFQFHSGSDPRVGLNVGVQIERGFYLLRVQGPTGEIHILPVVRKD